MVPNPPSEQYRRLVDLAPSGTSPVCATQTARPGMSARLAYLPLRLGRSMTGKSSICCRSVPRRGRVLTVSTRPAELAGQAHRCSCVGKLCCCNSVGSRSARSSDRISPSILAMRSSTACLLQAAYAASPIAGGRVLAGFHPNPGHSQEAKPAIAENSRGRQLRRPPGEDAS